MNTTYKKKYMDIALKNAIRAYKLNEVPVGCVIVHNDKIISSTYNTKNMTKCSLNHAEILAIKIATEKLGTFILDECDMYVTLEPCTMCIGAILQSKIKTLYIGATDETMGSVISKIPIIKDDLLYPYTIKYCFKKTISPYILKRFFRNLRKNKKIIDTKT